MGAITKPFSIHGGIAVQDRSRRSHCRGRASEYYKSLTLGLQFCAPSVVYGFMSVKTVEWVLPSSRLFTVTKRIKRNCPECQKVTVHEIPDPPPSSWYGRLIWHFKSLVYLLLGSPWCLSCDERDDEDRIL
jgi:hypothetical protein